MSYSSNFIFSSIWELLLSQYLTDSFYFLMAFFFFSISLSAANETYLEFSLKVVMVTLKYFVIHTCLFLDDGGKRGDHPLLLFCHLQPKADIRYLDRS